MTKQESRSTDRTTHILNRVRAIPKGHVQTYSDIDPGAPRLVGKVLATAPADVPWYRVVRADGTIPKGQPQLERLQAEHVPLRDNHVELAVARRRRPDATTT
jgi:methylated-DNA-protein-cysteine methyltransferase related protein